MAIKIFIDQGHNPTGYHNAGAQGFGLYEENITYQVGAYLANMLEEDERFEVRLSRPAADTVLGTNTTTSLRERVTMANDWPADYFISIHANSNPNPRINGSEAYIYEYGTQANWMAERILDGLVQYPGFRNNGIYENKALYVLRATNMPSLLVETGYLSNANDAEILENQQWLIAYGIYRGILKYFDFEPPANLSI